MHCFVATRVACQLPDHCADLLYWQLLSFKLQSHNPLNLKSVPLASKYKKILMLPNNKKRDETAHIQTYIQKIYQNIFLKILHKGSQIWVWSWLLVVKTIFIRSLRFYRRCTSCTYPKMAIFIFQWQIKYSMIRRSKSVEYWKYCLWYN